jgi:2-polyprenyl-6-hydroxyphenyl methylase/3-demethylubiquinone-9 3-methyltransferase
MALEIGCGYGEMLSILREEGFHVRGCDAGERAVAHCVMHGLDVQRAWWPDLPYSCGEADLSLSLQVIEHVPDPRAFTRDQVSLVRRGGIVVIATEDAWTSQCAWERLSRQLRGHVPAFRSPTDHTFVLQARHLRTLLEDAGCDVRTISFSRVPRRESVHWKMYKGLFRMIDHLVGHGDFLMAVARRT